MVNIILFFTNVLTSSSIAVEDSIKISSLIPSFLNFSASSIVETANIEIPLSIKNFVYSTIPIPYPLPFTTAIILTSFPASSCPLFFAYSFILLILCLKSSLLITNVFNFITPYYYFAIFLFICLIVLNAFSEKRYNL